MVMVFWDMKGPITIDFFVKVATINRPPYCQLLKQNSPYLLKNPYIGRVSRGFANGPGDRGSIPSQVIPKTQKMVLDTWLLNTQHSKVCITSKVEQGKK